MPYIDKEDRPQYDSWVKELAYRLQAACPNQMDRVGHANYVITTLVLQAFPERRYATMCLVDGLLHDIDKEWHDRRRRPYEDEKIEENGDVGY
jgi:hypothetical protein